MHIAAGAALATLALTACGGDSNKSAGDTPGTQGTRTISLSMRDIAFSPTRVDVRAGETVRFVFRNTGKIKHDAFIGDEAAQAGHESEMQQNTGMDMNGIDHGGSGGDAGITVDPGKTGELTRTFAAGDQVVIGCHQPGHYKAGMKVAISLS